MQINSADVVAGITVAQESADAALQIMKLTGTDSELPISADSAEQIVNLLGKMLSGSITAYNAAASVPITAESIAALMADPTPLAAPTQ